MRQAQAPSGVRQQRGCPAASPRPRLHPSSLRLAPPSRLARPVRLCLLAATADDAELGGGGSVEASSAAPAPPPVGLPARLRAALARGWLAVAQLPGIAGRMRLGRLAKAASAAGAAPDAAVQDAYLVALAERRRATPGRGGACSRASA